MDSEASDEEVEEQFTMQLEQLIKQCEDELGLIPKMAEWKPWEVPPGHKVLYSLCCRSVVPCPRSAYAGPTWLAANRLDLGGAVLCSTF